MVQILSTGLDPMYTLTGHPPKLQKWPVISPLDTWDLRVSKIIMDLVQKVMREHHAKMSYQRQAIQQYLEKISLVRLKRISLRK